MKITLDELRENNGGYAWGKDAINKDDLQLINGIIERIEQTRTEQPQMLDNVVYTNEFGEYYPNAIFDGATYGDDSSALCERGSAYVFLDKNKIPRGSISGGSFPRIDKNKLRYIGKAKKLFWTFSTLGAGAHQGLYFWAEVSCFELNERSEQLKQYTEKDYNFIFVRDWGKDTSPCGYKYTITGGDTTAFKTEQELKEYLKLYEAAEEPCHLNECGTKKYWILKGEDVSVWTEEEFNKIENTIPSRLEYFNGRMVPIKYLKQGTKLYRYILRADEKRYV